MLLPLCVFVAHDGAGIGLLAELRRCSVSVCVHRHRATCTHRHRDLFFFLCVYLCVCQTPQTARSKWARLHFWIWLSILHFCVAHSLAVYQPDACVCTAACDLYVNADTCEWTVFSLFSSSAVTSNRCCACADLPVPFAVSLWHLRLLWLGWVGVPVSTNTPDSRSLSAWAKAENAARSFRTRSRLLQNHWPVVKHQGTGCQHPGVLGLDSPGWLRTDRGRVWQATRSNKVHAVCQWWQERWQCHCCQVYFTFINPQRICQAHNLCLNHMQLHIHGVACGTFTPDRSSESRSISSGADEVLCLKTPVLQPRASDSFKLSFSGSFLFFALYYVS